MDGSVEEKTEEYVAVSRSQQAEEAMPARKKQGPFLLAAGMLLFLVTGAVLYLDLLPAPAAKVPPAPQPKEQGFSLQEKKAALEKLQQNVGSGQTDYSGDTKTAILGSLTSGSSSGSGVSGEDKLNTLQSLGKQ